MKPIWEHIFNELAKPGKGSVQPRKKYSKKSIKNSIREKNNVTMLPEIDFFIKIKFVGNFDPSLHYRGNYDLDCMVETVIGALSGFIIPDDKYVMKIEAQKVTDGSYSPGEGHTEILIYRLG